MIRIFMVDNYDSFTYNLVQLIMSNAAVEMVVKRNDEFDIKYVYDLAPDGIVISPGPKGPKDAGLSKQVIKEFSPKVPILGVCLGMQCINEVFGGITREAETPVHGKTSMISHNCSNLFFGISNPIKVARYHSLIIDKIPSCLEVDAFTEPGTIPMAIHHKKYPAFGVQFHPESFLTEEGDIMIKNFTRLLV
ncbi:MAG: aminodeoxychorismate/anthranilate synthase component II [Pseudomonadota bacterium]